MYTDNNMYEVKSAIERYQRNYSAYERRPHWRSVHRQWDYIIGMVCTGCGKPLSRFDTGKGRAFCYQCRQILFPEPEERRATYKNRFRQPWPKRHYR